MKAPDDALVVWRCGAKGCRRTVGWVEAVGPLQVIPSLEHPQLGTIPGGINNELTAYFQARADGTKRDLSTYRDGADDGGHRPDVLHAHCGRHWGAIEVSDGVWVRAGGRRTVFSKPVSEAVRTLLSGDP